MKHREVVQERGFATMTIQLSKTMKRAEDLIRNDRRARYAAYAVLILATAYACFDLGERFGAFAYILTH